jgi:hypothetical protein
MFAQLGGLMKRQSDGVNETKPVDCLCAAYAVCGCDDTGDLTFLADLIGDGSYAGLNKSVIDVADINGTSTIILNGTLPNGTTVADPNAPDETTSSDSSASTPGAASTLQASGFLALAIAVGGMVFVL